MVRDKQREPRAGNTRKKLVLEYDVTGLDDDEIGALEGEVVVQGEASDGHGGKRYDGKTGHPDVPVLGVQLTRTGSKAALVVEFDITSLSKKETGYLGAEAEVQASDSEDHPDVRVTSRIVSFTRKPT